MNGSRRQATKCNANMQVMEELSAKFLNTAASQEPPITDPAETIQLSMVRQTDLSEVLPNYTAILSSTADEGIMFKHLGLIQQELEKLLSMCAVRQRALATEIDSIDKVDDRKEKKGKSHEKPSAVKKRRAEDKSRNRSACNSLRTLNKPSQSMIKTNSLNVETTEVEPLPRHETSDKFWLSVDSYSQDITKDNLIFLEELITECSQATEVKIPVLGKHYATEWSENGIQDEQTNGCFTADSLQEEKSMASLWLTTVLEKFKSGDYIRGLNGIRNGTCLEKRLRTEHKIDIDDISKSISREDEILKEIKKCQQELNTVNQQNITELSTLREVLRKDLHRQKVRAELEKVDRAVLNMYNKVLLAKEKQQDLKEFEQEAQAIVKQQEELHAKLQEFSGMTLL